LSDRESTFLLYDSTQLNSMLIMRKFALFLSSIAASSVLFISVQPAPSIAADAAPSVGSSTKPVMMKKAKKQKSTMGKKSKSSGRCVKPDDLDAKGKRCGGRASSVRPGGR
jgi:hypothetical protein